MKGLVTMKGNYGGFVGQWGHMHFISEWKACSLKIHLKELLKLMQVPVINIDSTKNHGGPMRYFTCIIVEYKGHRELIQFLVTNMHDSAIVLGYNWLKRHNPNIDWLNGTIMLNWCLTQCHL